MVKIRTPAGAALRGKFDIKGCKRSEEVQAPAGALSRCDPRGLGLLRNLFVGSCVVVLFIVLHPLRQSIAQGWLFVKYYFQSLVITKYCLL